MRVNLSGCSRSPARVRIRPRQSDEAAKMREIESRSSHVARHRPTPAGSGRRLRFRAPAKINFGLEMVGRRPDRYHEVVSVMQAIDLKRRNRHFRITSGPETPCGQPNLGFTPTPLTDAALQHLACRTGRHPGQYVQVAKSIPSAAGLGGGSSDAATTLLAVNRESGSHLGQSELTAICRRLGSDVTFFLTGGCALVSGRGEIISRTLPTPDSWIVLANPNLELSTPSVYAELRKNEYSTGERTRALADSIAHGHPDWDLMANGLQAAAIRLCPLIEPILEILAAHTAHRQLSGSGPTCFGLFQSQETAIRRPTGTGHKGYWTWLGRPIGRWQLEDLELP